MNEIGLEPEDHGEACQPNNRECFRVLDVRRQNLFKEYEEVCATNRLEEEPASYLEREIFPLLLPSLEDTLVEAQRQNALRIQKCRFNGLDYLAETLWNRNAGHSRTSSSWVDAFNVPRLKVHASSRPYYPKSWLWSDEDAALHLQRYIRGWLVRKRKEVQEMRQFWKVTFNVRCRFSLANDRLPAFGSCTTQMVSTQK